MANMYAVIGYTADADIYCADCIDTLYHNRDTDNEGNTIQGYTASDAANGANDYVVHCGKCGDELLTL